MQEIHRKRSSLSRWSGWAVVSGLLVHDAAARQRSGLSRPASIIRAPAARARRTRSRTCGVLMNLCREEVRPAFCVHCILISTPLYSLYSTSSAEVHRCRVSFSISGATAWTDDQIRLIASICMFLLVFGKRLNNNSRTAIICLSGSWLNTSVNVNVGFLQENWKLAFSG